MTSEEVQKKNETAQRRAHLAELLPIDFATLQQKVDEWMIVPDRGIIKFLCALYITNLLSRRAVWAIIIGPSGGGKTEFLNGLLDLPNIFEISTLTTNTFLSGMPGRGDASLLPQLSGKIMIFKDWTSVLSLQKDARAEIMAQLREIWDGRMKKVFGNGKTREWEGKVSLIAASTQAVDQAQQMHTTLGERFINYRIIMPPRKEVAMKSLNNDKDQNKMGLEIRDAFFSFFKGLDLESTKELPDLPQEVKKELVDLANFCTMARSGVIRDFGFKKEVIFVPMAEMPTRIVQQLNSVASGLIVVNGGEYQLEDMNIVYKVALDSIPETNKIVMRAMARGDEQTTAEIATELGYPTAPIRMYLENLALLGVCDRIKGGASEDGGVADKWTMKEEFVNIVRRYEKIKLIAEERADEAARLAEEAEEIRRQKESETLFGGVND